MKKQSASIVIVCRGNIARSPFAEAVITQELAHRGQTDRLHIASRGVQGTTVDPEPVKYPNITFYPDLYASVGPLFDALGIDLSHHASTPISATDALGAKLLIAMDELTKQKLLQLFPESSSKILLFSEVFGGQKDVIDPEAHAASTTQILTNMHDQVVKHFDRLISVMDKIA